MEGFSYDTGNEALTEYDANTLHEALAGLLDLRSFMSKSMSMEMKRWFSLTYVFPTLDKEWTGVKAVLEWMRVQLAEWAPDNLAEMDAFQADMDLKADGLMPAEPVGAAKTDAEDLALRRQETLAQLRTKAKNTLHLAGMVAQDRKVQIHGRIIHAFSLIGRESVAMDLEQQHTQLDTVQWYANRAWDGGLAMCKQIAALPDSMEFLRATDIIQRLHMPNGDRDLFYDALETAELIFKMAVEHMSLTAWTDQVHAQTMPFTLAIGMHLEVELAEQGLYACARDWKAILEVVAAVFNASHPDVEPVPGNSNYDHDLDTDPHADLVNGELGPGHATVAGRFLFLKQLLEDLDFHKHQLVREACFLYSQGDVTSGMEPWNPLLPDGEQLLWQMFATPANTKFWCEDMFRDITGILGNRAFNCSRFSRMEAVVKASEMRASHKMPHVSLSFQDVGSAALPKNIRQVRDACFAVQTDCQKAQMAEDEGMTFDLGQPFHGNAPLIDVTPLMDVPPSKKKQKAEAADGPASTPGPASNAKPSKKTWKPAGQESNHKSVAARALIAEMLQKGWQEKEQMAADSWWAVLLPKGLVFKYFDQELKTHRRFISLGYHGHATLLGTQTH